MSMDDFSRCTPFEFNSIWEKWNEMHETEMRGEWERLRYVGMFVLQPYSKKTLKPTDIMRFPWDDKKENDESKTFDAEAKRKRYEEAKKRYGIK